MRTFMVFSVVMSLSVLPGTVPMANAAERAAPAEARNAFSINVANLLLSTVDLSYVRSFSPSFAWVASADYAWRNVISQRFLYRGSYEERGAYIGSIGAGVQWFPFSDAAPAGFYLAPGAQLALTTEGGYLALSADAGYRWLFAPGFTIGIAGGVSHASSRVMVTSPRITLDLGWVL
ncbi:hypothetical protein [Cystobacter fuscus]|uniref:hypothetical protein n=1 Tax=Cystobacter fuscus TaxID=43 RepID=UPI0005B8F289|nr:hypothetical protein [Cystobacter fuscus]